MKHARTHARTHARAHTHTHTVHPLPHARTHTHTAELLEFLTVLQTRSNASRYEAILSLSVPPSSVIHRA